MKKSKLIMFCLTVAACTMMFGGCSRGNDENTTETPSDTQKETPRETPRETESSKGRMDEIGDEVETMLDPTR